MRPVVISFDRTIRRALAEFERNGCTVSVTRTCVTVGEPAGSVELHHYHDRHVLTCLETFRARSGWNASALDSCPAAAAVAASGAHADDTAEPARLVAYLRDKVQRLESKLQSAEQDRDFWHHVAELEGPVFTGDTGPGQDRELFDRAKRRLPSCIIPIGSQAPGAWRGSSGGRCSKNSGRFSSRSSDPRERAPPSPMRRCTRAAAKPFGSVWDRFAALRVLVSRTHFDSQAMRHTTTLPSVARKPLARWAPLFGLVAIAFGLGIAAGAATGSRRGAARTGASMNIGGWKKRMPNKRNPTRIDIIHFEDDGSIPNNPRLPLLHYHGVLDDADRAAAFEAVLARNGWTGSWRNGIYGYHHFHSTAHEVLGIARGDARVRLGGDGGVTVELLAGDVVVIPAGVGHKNEGASGDFLVVGAYPHGQEPDLRTGRPGEHERVVKNIRAVPLPLADPLFGRNGPLLREWPAD